MAERRRDSSASARGNRVLSTQLPNKQDAAPPGATPWFQRYVGTWLIALVLSASPTFPTTGTTACTTGSRPALALSGSPLARTAFTAPRTTLALTRAAWPGIQLGTTRTLAFSALRASLPAIAVAFASPHGLPLVLVERSVAILVELRKTCIGAAFALDFFRGAVQPFLLADHAVTIGVQLGEQLAVTALAFSFLRMQGPCEAQHGNDSNYD